MSIAIVNQPLDGILPPNQNSIGIWTYEVAKRLSAHRDVTVFGPHSADLRARGVPRASLVDGVNYRFFATAPSRVWPLLSARTARLRGPDSPIYASSAYFVEYASQVAVALRRSPPDVAHIHNFTGFLPIIRRLNPSLPLVLHMSCEWLSQLDADKMRSRIEMADAVVGTSEHITGLIRHRFPDLADRLFTVYNGVDPAEFDQHGGRHQDSSGHGTDGPVVLFIGRVSPEKGVHDLIDAMNIVRRHHPTAQLQIVGAASSLPTSYIIDVSEDPAIRDLARFYERPYLDSLREQVPPDALAQVIFRGGVPHDEVVDLMRRSDVLVNPSYSESFGITPVEAMACRTPVVATKVGGMKETVIDGVTGFLVERSAPEQIADRVNQILDNKGLRTAMGSAGRDRVVRLFSWQSVSRSIDEVYSEVQRRRADRDPRKHGGNS